jgi:Tol biopolymer transport system component
MALASGDRLGAYEILAPLGAGGMGEVYRARDSRLGREVAIKVLPSDYSADRDRLRRFEQEARATCRLNHPNIVSVHDIGTHNDAPFLVYELLEGQTLRERLSAGALPLSKALDYAMQMARALGQAHAKGVVHRDLKPENVFVTHDGQIKVFDFGLAKLKPDVVGQLGGSRDATLTHQGGVLGTAGYMAPEQVRGQPADHRADLFSLGAILYEMISGSRAFRGASTVETMNAILTEDPPPLEARKLPPIFQQVLARCLEKDPAARFQSAEDLAFNLKLVSSLPAVGALPRQEPARRRLILAALGLAIAMLAAGVFVGRMLLRREPIPTSSVQVHRLTEFVGLEQFPALSPDGRSVAFIASVNGKRQLWVRLLAGGPALQLTRDPKDHLDPRWSRDSSSLVYFAEPLEGEEAGSLWEISALGGMPRRLVSSLRGADLSASDDRLAFLRLSQGKTELIVAKRDGSELKVMAELETGYSYGTPRWSPDGRSIAFERRYYGWALDGIYVLRTGEKKPTRVVSGSSVNGFAWLPDSSGIVFSSAQGSSMIYLETFHLWSFRLGSSEPRQLTFGESSYLQPDVNRAGELVASRMRLQSDLWRFPVDGDGAQNVRRAVPVTRQTGEVRTPSVSPNGREVVYVSDIGGHSNLWISNLEKGDSRQLTFERDPKIVIGVPLWSPDGRKIAFYWKGEKEFGYSVIQPDGSGLRQIVTAAWWACWSPDSRWLYYQDQRAAPSGHLYKVPIDGGSLVVVRAERATMPVLSPDGKTLYFAVEVPKATSFDHEIRAASPENAPSRLVARIGAHRIPESGRFHPVISPDGRWLALPLTDGVATNIWALSTADGTLRQITDFGNRPTFITRRVSWAPDGHSIYAAVSEGDADIVLFDGLKP